MKAPIVVFVYNRIDHVRRLFDSLFLNPECSDSALYIYSDGAKNEGSIIKVEEVRDYIRRIPDMGLFKHVEICESVKNKGLSASIIDGVTTIMEKYGRAIVIEDDNIVSPDFLDYMNRALDFYQDDASVWCIGGFSREMTFPEDYHHDVFMMQRMSSYTWASWKDRWERTEWDLTKFYPAFFFDRKNRKGFESCGSDRALMLDAQACGKKNSWAIRFEYSMYRFNMYSVLPCISRAECGGNDGSGTHSSRVDNKFDTKMSDGAIKAHFDHLKQDERIRKEFAKAYHKSIKRKLLGNIDYVLYFYTHNH